jgi:hypothetical protein
MRLEFEGLPTMGVTERIELPSVAEILRSPMFTRVSADDFYKYGGEFNRYLLDKCPISNEFKHVCVTANLKIVAPETMPMRTSDWHCDGSVGSPYFSFDEKFHIFIGYTDATTEFLLEPAHLEVDEHFIKSLDHYQFRQYIESEIHNFENLKPIKMEEQVFVTFNSRHLHRAPRPTPRPYFRLMVIVRESNHLQEIAPERARDRSSEVWSVTADKGVLSIEQGERGIMLRPLRI